MLWNRKQFIFTLVPTALHRRHTQTVEASSSSYKIDYFIVIKNSKSWGASKSHQWFKSYDHYTEGVHFAYCLSFSGGGSAPAACAAGLFFSFHWLGLVTWVMSLGQTGLTWDQTLCISCCSIGYYAWNRSKSSQAL